MMLRARAIQVVIESLCFLAAWYIFQFGDNLSWLPDNLNMIALSLVSIGLVIVFSTNIVRLTLNIPFFYSDRNLADKILLARDGHPADSPIRKISIWFALQYHGLLKMTGFMIVGVVITMYVKPGTIEFFTSIFFTCLFVSIVYREINSLRKRRKLVEDDEELSNKYYFLIPYQWNFIYDYPRLLTNDRFSPYQKRKIESLYRQIFLLPSLWFAGNKELCWYCKYDEDDDRFDERTLPYRIPDGKLTLN